MNSSKKKIQLENGKTVTVSKTNFPISGQKFKKVVERKGLTYSDISTEMGYSSRAVSSAIGYGYMSSVMIKGIESTFGIKYEDYAYIHPEEENPEEKLEEKTEQQEAQVIPQVEVDEKLYNTIKVAVVAALNEIIASKNLSDFTWLTRNVTSQNSRREEI